MPLLTQIGTSGLKDSAVTEDKLGANAVTTGKISDGTITNADVSPSAAIAATKLSGVEDSLTGIKDNIALLGFKMAVNEGLTVFNLVDGIVDEFEDQTGVDTSNTDNTYNAANDRYENESFSPDTVSFYGNASVNHTDPGSGDPTVTYTGAPNPAHGTGNFGSIALGSNTSWSSVTAYVFGAGGSGKGKGPSPTLYNYGTGGGGGFASGTLSLTPGNTYYIRVGEGGQDAQPSAVGGGGSAGGGGASWIATSQTNSAPATVLVGGGGGGGNASTHSGGLGQYNGARGGKAGGSQGYTQHAEAQTSADGSGGFAGAFPYAAGGGGGSQTAGGQGGPGPSNSGGSGSLLQGGSNKGGGGFYGGGGAGGAPGGGGNPATARGGGAGGGGSSYYGNPIVSSGSYGGTADVSPLDDMRLASHSAPQPQYATAAALISNTPGGTPGGSYGGMPSAYYPMSSGGFDNSSPLQSAVNIQGGDGAVVISYSYSSGAADVDIVSDDFTASSEPTSARIVVFEEDVDSITLNTDLIAKVSRDGGTTYTSVTLEDAGYVTGSSGQRILTGSATISGQPSGTTMKYKLESANNKHRIHGVSLQWS